MQLWQASAHWDCARRAQAKIEGGWALGARTPWPPRADIWEAEAAVGRDIPLFRARADGS
jgi:hypothetical protein